MTVRMHADEVEIDLSLVRRLVAEQLPAWAELPLERVPAWGTDNALFRLGDEMVVRLPRTRRTTETLAKERQWLPTLAPGLPFDVPLPLADGGPGAGYPFDWCVYRWLEGEDATAAEIEDPERLALELAGFIRALQGLDQSSGPQPGAHNFGRGEPLARRDEATRAAIRALDDVIDSGAATAAWSEALRAPAWDRPPVWVHGDLDARNLLLTAGRLSAVIDWGGLGVGDPACDVAVAWKLLPAPARDAFCDALGVDAATWARARGWVVSQAVIALAYYTVETNAVLVAESRRWLAASLDG